MKFATLQKCRNGVGLFQLGMSVALEAYFDSLTSHRDFPVNDSAGKFVEHMRYYVESESYKTNKRSSQQTTTCVSRMNANRL